MPVFPISIFAKTRGDFETPLSASSFGSVLGAQTCKAMSHGCVSKRLVMNLSTTRLAIAGVQGPYPEPSGVSSDKDLKRGAVGGRSRPIPLR